MCHAATFDFGTVKKGETVTHSFTIPNRGATELRIASIDLSAPGMTARATQPVIAPHREETIAIEWETDSVSRKVRGTATVHFDDPKQPPVELALTGTVVPPIDAFPIPGFFIALFRDERVQKSIRVVNNQDHPVLFEVIGPASPSFTTSLKTLTDGKAYELSVEIPSGLPPGHRSESIQLRTDDPQYPLVQIPVNLFVKNDVFANPEAVDFGELDRARLAASPEQLEAVSQKIFVEARKGTFAIEDVRSDLPMLRASVSPRRASKRFEIAVGLNGERLAAGSLSGTITILTTDERFHEITVPVRGEVR